MKLLGFSKFDRKIREVEDEASNCETEKARSFQHQGSEDSSSTEGCPCRYLAERQELYSLAYGGNPCSEMGVYEHPEYTVGWPSQQSRGDSQGQQQERLSTPPEEQLRPTGRRIATSRRYSADVLRRLELAERVFPRGLASLYSLSREEPARSDEWRDYGYYPRRRVSSSFSSEES